MHRGAFTGVCQRALGLALAVGLAGCEAGSQGPSGYEQGAGGSAGSSLDAGDETSNVGGSGGSEDAAADGFFDATGTGGGGGLQSDAACTGVTETAENKTLPVDIIFALDNSGSMNTEATFVQQHMNVFSYGLPMQIDPHVVILSANQGQSNGVCIDPPLGSGSCPNDDNPPSFLHVDQIVQSSDALILLLDRFDDYSSTLRAGAIKHVVVVSDDDSSMSAADFDQQFKARLQAFGGAPEYTFHGIFAFTNPFPFTCMNNPAADTCCAPWPELVYSADIGEEYAKLVNMTGGVAGNLCLQDFSPVFNAVTAEVQASTKLACEWDIPEPPDGGVVDPKMVNVMFSTGGSPAQPLGYVESAQACSSVDHGWYYDDPDSPTKVVVCPQTCTMLQGHADAQITIEFGCERRPAVPK